MSLLWCCRSPTTATRHWPVCHAVCQLNRLQSVLNADARSIAGLRRSDHVSDAMASFHWLRVPERIRFKVAVLTFRTLHRTAPRYLSDDLRRIDDIPSRGRLRSAATNRLDIRPPRLKIGERAFASAGHRIWNSLPDVSHFRCFVGSLKPICLNFPILTLISSFSVFLVISPIL